MSVPNSDEVEGKWEQVKGTVKDKVGEATGDKNLEAEGEAQDTAGKAQENWGGVKRGVSDAVDSVGNAIKDAADNINKG